MSVRFYTNSTALATNITSPFSAWGGVPPYTYSVVPGGAGGTINSSSGLYQAPSVIGVDQIRVVDAGGDTFQIPILIGTPIQLVCDIIQNQLALNSSQVYLWDQKFNIPTDNRLYIAVGILSCKPFSNNNYWNGSGSGLTQVQYTNFLATLSIDIFSRGTAARDRKEEVIMALNSLYAKGQQELNSFFIAPISSNFVNLSEIDGAAIPYRFNISVNLQYFVSKTTSVDYYSSFSNVSIASND